LSFPDQHLINNPYKIMLAQGEWTCTVADFRGTMLLVGKQQSALDGNKQHWKQRTQGNAALRSGLAVEWQMNRSAGKADGRERSLAQARSADVFARSQVLSALADLAFTTGDSIQAHRGRSHP
jgi:hypothetical protein